MSEASASKARKVQNLGRDLGRTTLGDLLERAIPYEHWRAPVDRRLRVLTWVAGGVLVLNLALLTSLPVLVELSRGEFFMVLGDVLEGLFTWLQERAPLLMVLNMLGLGLYGVLLWRTRALETGTLLWQRVAFGEVIGGAVGAIPLTVSLGIGVVNVALWIVAIVIGVILGLLGTIAIFGLMFLLLGAFLQG